MCIRDRLVTPQPLTNSCQTGNTQKTSNTEQRRPHHPVIAQYLGLGADNDSSHLDKYAPALPLTPPTQPKTRKRNRKARDSSSPAKAVPSQPKQRRISDDFGVVKAVASGTRTVRKNVLPSKVSLSSFTTTKNDTYPPNENNEHAKEQQHTSLTQALAALTSSSPNSSATLVASHANHSQALFEDDTIADEFFDDVFDSMDMDSTIDQPVTNTQPQGAHNTFGCSGLANSSATIYAAEEFLSSTPDLTDDFSSPFQPKASLHESSIEVANRGSDVHTALEIGDAPRPHGKFVSPVTKKTEALVRKEAMTRSHTTDHKPIIRPLFPDPVRDRSPVIGLSSNLVLLSLIHI